MSELKERFVPVVPRGMRKTISFAIFMGAFLTMATPAQAGDIPPGRFGIGDSIMLSASDELRPLGYTINAEVGRQFTTGVDVARRLAARDKLPRIVVFHLGTNGTIPADGCEALQEAVGRRQLFLVTIRVPRSWQEPNNDLLNGCAASSERIHIVRWFAHSNGHPEWFATDGYHLTTEGQAAYTALLDRAVNDTVAALRSARDR